MPKRKCLEPDCPDNASSKGRCGKHYQRERRRAAAALRVPVTPEQRYEAKVDRSGGPDACHPWTAMTDFYGYGLFWFEGRPVLAHRWGFQRFKHPLRRDQAVRHTCDNRPCQNPRHWLYGSWGDNNRDKTERDRNAKGEEQGHARLTAPEVLAIRADWRGEWGQLAVLGRAYNVHPETVSDIVYRKTWAWLAPGENELVVASTHRVDRERCRHGHELTDDNVWFVDGNPEKYRCLTCRRFRDLANYYAKTREGNPEMPPMPEHLLPYLSKRRRQKAA